MVHVILDTDFTFAPPWLAEGLASLYEAPVFTPRQPFGWRSVDLEAPRAPCAAVHGGRRDPRGAEEPAARAVARVTAGAGGGVARGAVRDGCGCVLSVPTGRLALRGPRRRVGPLATSGEPGSELTHVRKRNPSVHRTFRTARSGAVSRRATRFIRADAGDATRTFIGSKIPAIPSFARLPTAGVRETNRRELPPPTPPGRSRR
jgi:hypothetical protein